VARRSGAADATRAMSAWLAGHLAPLMFAALALALFSGVPVVFALAGCGLGFAWLGV